MTAHPGPPALRCPSCGEPLAFDGREAECPRGHAVDAVAGIVDLRGSELPGFDVAADRRLAEQLVACEDASLEELLRLYWRGQPGVGPALVERFVRGDLVGERRAAEVVGQVEELIGRRLTGADCVLELGAGTAALSAAVAPMVGHVVVSDISLAWLVLARHRLGTAGIDRVTLVATTGDRLPFAACEFDAVLAADVIEHVPDPDALVAACYRVLRPGGAMWLSTPNRLSLTPEPHVRVWGVGLLPRPLGRRLVRWLRGVPYDDVRTLSVFGLRRALVSTGGRVRVTAPGIAAAVRAGYPLFSRRLIGVYELARRMPIVKLLLLLVTPLFHAVVVKPEDAAAH